MCDLCYNNKKDYKYVLCDNSTIDICKECGTIVYEKNIQPVIPGERLFHIIALIEYVKAH